MAHIYGVLPGDKFLFCADLGLRESRLFDALSARRQPSSPALGGEHAKPFNVGRVAISFSRIPNSFYCG